MSQRYDDYIKDHRNNVYSAFDWLIRYNILSGYSIDTVNDAHHLCEFDHDASKYLPEEYDAYDEYFYGNRSYQAVEDFKRAWLHHIHSNPHHWQHWVLINDDPDKAEIILDMPDCYIIEMICDWMSFSIAAGDLHELFTWYDAHKDYMRLSERTRKEVEHILTMIKNIIESDSNGEEKTVSV